MASVRLLLIGVATLVLATEKPIDAGRMSPAAANSTQQGDATTNMTVAANKTQYAFRVCGAYCGPGWCNNEWLDEDKCGILTSSAVQIIELNIKPFGLPIVRRGTTAARLTANAGSIDVLEKLFERHLMVTVGQELQYDRRAIFPNSKPIEHTQQILDANETIWMPLAKKLEELRIDGAHGFGRRQCTKTTL